MKLLVIGATQGIGRNLVEQALDREHAVTAWLRNPRRLSINQRALTTHTVSVRSAYHLKLSGGCASSGFMDY